MCELAPKAEIENKPETHNFAVSITCMFNKELFIFNGSVLINSFWFWQGPVKVVSFNFQY